MKSTLARCICRLLAFSLVLLPWQAQAGLIGTDQAVRAPLAAPVDRDAVAALTDAELAQLAGQVEALPAGGIAGLLPIIVAVILIWHFSQPDPMSGKAAKTTAKPAPEKK